MDKIGYRKIPIDSLLFVNNPINLFNEFLTPGRIKADGKLRDTQSYITTDFININYGKIYCISQLNNTINCSAYGFYDNKYNTIIAAEATQTTALSIPSNAAYVRFSYTSTTTSNKILIFVSDSNQSIDFSTADKYKIETEYMDSNFIGVNNATYGSENNNYISNWTFNGGANYSSSTGYVYIPVGGSMTKIINNIVANTPYIIDVSVVLNNDYKPYTPMQTLDSRLLIQLSDASINIFGANDGTFEVVLTPQTGGNVNLTISSGENWYGYIEAVSIKAITSYPSNDLKINNLDLFNNSRNTNYGSGLTKIATGIANTSIGYHAQDELNTGRYNNAHGYGAQQYLTNGSSNNAFGSFAQQDATTAMYNNAFGSSSQRHLTKGCWNVAMGNESQRDITEGCNNIAIGRRSQNDITIGQRNIAIGALSGFISTGRSQVSTMEEQDQVLIGFMSTQLHRNSNQNVAIGAMSGAGNNAIAIGYGVEAQDNEIAIGNSNNNSLKICGRKIIFNNDGTISWN